MTYDVLFTKQNTNVLRASASSRPLLWKAIPRKISRTRADLQALLVGGRMIPLDLDATPEGHPWQPCAGLCADDPDGDAFQTSL